MSKENKKSLSPLFSFLTRLGFHSFCIIYGQCLRFNRHFSLIAVIKWNRLASLTTSLDIVFNVHKWEWYCSWNWKVKGFDIFASSLLGTIIQDGGKRERSDSHVMSY